MLASSGGSVMNVLNQTTSDKCEDSDLFIVTALDSFFPVRLLKIQYRMLAADLFGVELQECELW